MVFLKLHSSFLMMGAGSLLLKGNLLIYLRYVLLALLIVLTTTSFATVYYVSSSGDDGNSGLSPTDAWNSLDKVNSFSPSPGDQILFKRGESWVGTLKIPSSGSSGSPIVYGAFGSGENPKIYNSKKVENWESYSGSIYKANFSADNIEQVFVDDVRVNSARYPNSGYFDITTVNGSNKFTSNQIRSGLNYSGALAVIRDKEWSISSRSVTGSSSQTITLASAPMYDMEKGQGFVLVGKLEFLDQAGEWYYDKNSETLYLWTPNNASPENYTIRASTTDNAIYIDNKSYVTIQNLSLLHSNADGIYINKSSYITIDNNNIEFPDNRGMTINSISSTNITISNNVVNGANHDGIKIDGTYHVISDNTIKNIRLFENFGVGGLGDAMGGRGLSIIGGYCTVKYNSIENVGYNGIGFFNAPYTTIEYNFIKNACLTTQDGGGIYCYNTSVDEPGCQYSEIRGNIIDNVPGNIDGCTTTIKQGAGIYMDDRIHHVTIEDNTIARSSFYGVYLHNNKYITVSNNTIFDNASGYRVTGSFGATQNSIQNNTILNISTSGSESQATLGLLNSSEKSIVSIDNNKYIDKHRDTPFANTNDYSYKTFSQWKSLTGGDSNSTLDNKSLGEGEEEKLIYNSTKQDKTINLGSNVYLDTDGNTITGKITLKPFTSKILIGTNIEDIGANQSPQIDDQFFEITAPLPKAGVVGQVLASDPDEDQSLNFSITSGNNENLFYIDSETGNIYSNTEIATNQNSKIELTVTATDDGLSPLSASAIVIIYIITTEIGGTTLIADTIRPTINSFTIPELSSTLSFPVLNFEATDNNQVTGYLITETNTEPSATNSGWLPSAPDTFTISSSEISVLYAWTKDEAGNISNAFSATIKIGDSYTFSEYLFEEESGATVYDSQASNNGKIINGDIRLEGIKGSGLQLDGTNYINVGDCFSENIKDQLTLSAWIKPDVDFYGYQGIIMHGGQNFDTYAIYINQTNKRVAFKTSETSEPWLAIDNLDEIWDGGWHNITAVCNGKEKIIYIDNVLVATSENSGNIASGTGHNLIIGAGRDTESPSLLYRGQIDEVRIFNYALSIDQIKERNNIPVYTTEKISICDGENYQGWIESGTYERTLVSTSGADSIVTTELVVNPTYNVTEEITIQEGEDYQGWTEEGEYVRTLTSSTGCDSTITTTLIVEDQFQISDLLDIIKISPQKSSSESSYSTQEYVVATTSEESDNFNSFSFNSNSSDFIIYPNPVSSSSVNIEFNSIQNEKIILEIVDSKGIVRVNRSVENISNQIDLSGFSAGLYFVIIKTEKGSNTKKLIVK